MNNNNLYLTGDTESTGLLNFQNLKNLEIQPHICQLGLELTDENEKVFAEINILIKPNGWTIPKAASDVHGITTEQCEKYGIDIKRALAIITGYALLNPIFLAHNKAYDLTLIDIEYQRLGKESPLKNLKQICTMEATTNLVKIPKARGGYKWAKLQEAYMFCFGKNFDGAHDAMIDVRSCREIFFDLKRKNLITIP